MTGQDRVGRTCRQGSAARTHTHTYTHTVQGSSVHRTTGMDRAGQKGAQQEHNRRVWQVRTEWVEQAGRAVQPAHTHTHIHTHSAGQCRPRVDSAGQKRQGRSRAIFWYDRSGQGRANKAAEQCGQGITGRGREGQWYDTPGKGTANKAAEQCGQGKAGRRPEQSSQGQGRAVV